MKKDIEDHARNDYIHVHVQVYVFALDNFPKIYIFTNVRIVMITGTDYVMTDLHGNHKMKHQYISVILIYVSYKYTVWVSPLLSAEL